VSAWWQTARANPTFRLTVLLAIITIVLDQASKLWILHGIKLPTNVDVNANGRLVQGHMDLGPIFDLTYVENTGVSFGLFAGGMVSRVLLTALALGVAIFILHWAGSLTRRWAAIGAGFIVGGAIGNAIDRASYGYVVDSLDFSALYFPWRFNIADTGVNLGVVCLAYDAFFVAPKSTAKGAEAETTAHFTSDEAGERVEEETFPDEHSRPIRPENKDSRSSE